LTAKLYNFRFCSCITVLLWRKWLMF
jgi:hypothetical protein